MIYKQVRKWSEGSYFLIHSFIYTFNLLGASCMLSTIVCAWNSLVHTTDISLLVPVELYSGLGEEIDNK